MQHEQIRYEPAEQSSFARSVTEEARKVKSIIVEQPSSEVGKYRQSTTGILEVVL